MFNKDQKQIADWCTTPDQMVTVGTMVLLSIRMQWSGVGTQLQDVQENGSRSKCLWGWKRAGYQYLRDNKLELFTAVVVHRVAKYPDDSALMRAFLKVPGLGLAKAGFMCQLLCGTVGCLDMHNIKRFQLDAKTLTIPKRVCPAKQLQVIDDSISFYIALCKQCGGTEKLWDEWCELLADKVSTFKDGAEVSRRHYTYLIDAEL
jgi:hypothetical protein